MHKNYFISDPHFGHSNILNFKDDQGKLVRPGFSSIEEHDTLIIDNINEVVRPQDKIFILGDIAMNRKYICVLDRIITKKRILLRGNHDIFKLKDYIPYFKDIRAYKVLPKHGIIFSHIPIHEYHLQGRWKLNVHGHMHHNTLDDKRYLNVCVEQTNYKPVELQEILEKIK